MPVPRYSEYDAYFAKTIADAIEDQRKAKRPRDGFNGSPVQVMGISPNPPEPGRNLLNPHLPGTREFTARVDAWQPPNPLTTKPSENDLLMGAAVGLTSPIAKITPWQLLKTGKEATFYGFRGEGGRSRSLLSQKWSNRMGRDTLLGEGVYIAPTKTIAANYGEPISHRVTLKNPYVIESATGTDVWKNLNVGEIKAAGHDGIVIKSGRGEGGEAMAQAIVFPEHSGQAVKAKPQPGEMVVGVKVKSVKEIKYGGETYPPGLEGKLAGFSPWGHPYIKTADGKKIAALNPDDIETIIK
jgi:hypothetical protein